MAVKTATTPSTPSVILSGCHKKLDTSKGRDNISYKEREMSVQDYIDNILDADNSYAISLFAEAIYEHPEQSDLILDAISGHLINISKPE